jgi:hypothetical protein
MQDGGFVQGLKNVKSVESQQRREYSTVNCDGCSRAGYPLGARSTGGRQQMAEQCGCYVIV